mgnify:CR=1 FL=1
MFRSLRVDLPLLRTLKSNPNEKSLLVCYKFGTAACKVHIPEEAAMQLDLPFHTTSFIYCKQAFFLGLFRHCALTINPSHLAFTH